MKNIAVVLAGCGRMDGSEVHESTLALYAIAKGGARWTAFAPDEPQQRVVDHATNTKTDETRNQMVEAARIARGEIRPLAEARADDFDALAIPGGNGAFANLGAGPGDVHPQLRRLILEFADAGKPIAAICIAPVLLARVLGDRGVEVTIGNDPETASAIEACGARHIACGVRHCHADAARKAVTTPAYMLGPTIADVGAGIEACIAQLLEWA